MGGVGIENGAMLTTLFRYTSECTISYSNFQNFFASGGNRALTPLTKILRTLLLSLPNTANQLQLKCMIIGLWSI